MTFKIGVVAAVICCLGCSGVAAQKTAVTAPAQPTAEPVQVRQSLAKVAVGQQQPLAQLTDVNGTLINLRQPEKRKLIIFFATWCHDSQRLMSQLQQSPLLNDPQLLIVAIGREEQPAALTKFANEYKLPLHFVSDPDRALYQQFTDTGIPRVVLVNEKNVVVKTFLGEIPRAIDEIVWP